jgi:hypothetical protein
VRPRIRWTPCSATAAVTSWRVSPGRLVGSMPLRLARKPRRVELGCVGGQRLHRQPGPLAWQPGAHQLAAVGGQPSHRPTPWAGPSMLGGGSRPARSGTARRRWPEADEHGVGAAQRLGSARLPAGVPAVDGRFAGPRRACERPRLGSGRRQTAPRPSCGRLRTAGGRGGPGRCGGKQLVSYRHPAKGRPDSVTGRGELLFF